MPLVFNPLEVVHNRTKMVDELPDYQVNFVQSRYCVEPVCMLYRIWVSHISGVLIVHRHT